MSVSRNAPCPCGSGKRYKRCCGNSAANISKTDSPPSPDVLLRNALQLLNSGKMVEAEKLLRTLRQLVPSNADTCNLLGIVCAQTDRHEEARMLLEEAVRLSPENMQYRYNLGNAQSGAGFYDESIKSFNAVLECQPNFPEAENNLGMVLCALNRPEEAYDHFSKAIALRPDYGHAHENLGNVSLQLDRKDEAVESLLIARRLQQDTPQLLNNLANAYSAKGEVEKAMELYDQALLIKEDGEILKNKGMNALEGRQYYLAVDTFKKAIQLMPDLADAYCGYGVALRGLGRLDEAVEFMQLAVDKAPGNTQISDALVDILNYHQPDVEARGPYVEAQASLHRVSTEYTPALKIADETVQQLYQQCHDVLVRYELDINTNNFQLFRGVVFDLNCYRHKQVFNTYNVIPEYCFNCYKVVIKPRTVVELFKLLLVIDKLKLPDDNSRKCMVEIRPEIAGTYKGFVFCRNLGEAEGIMSIVQKKVHNEISEEIEINVKRGCSEYQVAYPEYGYDKGNESQMMVYKEEWRKHEEDIDKILIELPDHNPNKFTNNHSGLTLFDALVMRNWLAYAAEIGDTSYQQISELPLSKLSIEK